MSPRRAVYRINKLKKKLLEQLRAMIGLEEVLFLSGMALLYAGTAAQFGHAAAQMVCGAVLIAVSLLITVKGSA